MRPLLDRKHECSHHHNAPSSMHRCAVFNRPWAVQRDAVCGHGGGGHRLELHRGPQHRAASATEVRSIDHDVVTLVYYTTRHACEPAETIRSKPWSSASSVSNTGSPLWHLSDWWLRAPAQGQAQCTAVSGAGGLVRLAGGQRQGQLVPSTFVGGTLCMLTAWRRQSRPFGPRSSGKRSSAGGWAPSGASVAGSTEAWRLARTAQHRLVDAAHQQLHGRRSSELCMAAIWVRCGCGDSPDVNLLSIQSTA